MSGLGSLGAILDSLSVNLVGPALRAGRIGISLGALGERALPAMAGSLPA